MNPVLDSLPVLILYPHSRCNCRCVMCDIWKTDSTQEISAAELERHGDDIARLRVEWVVFSGGEPLMHSDLFRLCQFLRERKIRTTLLSTGLLIERHANQIIECLDDVIVSLDGPREIHDAIRRVPGAFDLLAAGVTALHQRNPNFAVSARSTVQSRNCAALRATVEAARGLGLKSHLISRCRCIVGGIQPPSKFGVLSVRIRWRSGPARFLFSKPKSKR